ncbi:SPOR domain-containing protein [Prevotella sp. UBA4952]|nr:SPOR domain-containing protein [Prevotella sp. UBA4952]
MKQFVTFIFMILCPIVSANAQTIIDHLQKNVQGKGVVTVNQSKEIDELVNGKEKRTVTPSHQIYGNGKKQEAHHSNSSLHAKGQDHPAANGEAYSTLRNENKEQGENRNIAPTEKRQENKTTVKKEVRREPHKEDTTINPDENFDIPVIDMRKKVMRHSYKVTGYRVQAFAGGNSRKDRIAAQKAGNAIKIRYPDQPVYVHFYSPRWICRVGNFKSLNEATKMLRQIRAMGYRSACLVKGLITVQK